MDIKTIIFIGPQGSGKGTQVKNVEEYFENRGEPHNLFQTGEMFRTLQEKDSYVAKKVRGTLDKGTHQPLALSVSLWGHVLTKYSDPSRHHIIDGFPRRLEEAKLLDEMLEFCERVPVDVVFLDLDEETAVERLKGRGRADDTTSGIAKRMAFYEKYTKPIIPYYKEHDNYRFHEIDAGASPSEVGEGIFKALNISR